MAKDLEQIGKNALESIRDMVAALQCDYDRLQELRDNEERDDEETEELTALEQAAGDCADEDEARERIQDDPLSIEYRSDWSTDKTALEAAEVCLLLTTGGPAVRIIAELRDGCAHRPLLQVQDWGTNWTDYYEEGITEILQAYCDVFCFE